MYSLLIFSVLTLDVVGGTNPEIEIRDNSHIQIQNVSVENFDGELFLGGGLEKLTRSEKIYGHIDFVLYSSTGDVLREGAVQYRPRVASRRGLRQARFWIKLPEDGSVKRIILAFHEDSGERPKEEPVENDINQILNSKP